MIIERREKGYTQTSGFHTSHYYMGVEEFAERVMSGERDFNNMVLKTNNNRLSTCINNDPDINLDLTKHDGFKEMQIYLKNQNLRANPLLLNNSRLPRITAEELYLPYVKANHIDLEGTNIKHANFESAELECANFKESKIKKANFKYALLHEAILKSSKFDGTDFSHAIFDKTDLSYTSLKRAKFIKADFRNDVDFMYTKCNGADFENAEFSNLTIFLSDFRGANLNNANFVEEHLPEREKVTIWDSDFRDVKNLEKVTGLENIIFEKINMNPEHKKLIKKAILKNVFKK